MINIQNETPAILKLSGNKMLAPSMIMRMHSRVLSHAQRYLKTHFFTDFAKTPQKRIMDDGFKNYL